MKHYSNRIHLGDIFFQAYVDVINNFQSINVIAVLVSAATILVLAVNNVLKVDFLLFIYLFPLIHF